MQCPSENSLALLFEGALGEPESSEVRAHVASCASCDQVFRMLGSASTRPHSDGGGPGVASFDPILQALAVAPARPDIDPASEPPTPNLAQPRPGLMVGGRYRLESLLGEGGMGTVWAAVHVVTHQRFALKLIRQSHAQRPGMRRRMLREARAASAVNHPNVVRVVDVFEAEGGTPVLVMDLLVGETLRQRLRRQGRMTLGETARLLVPAMAAVQSAHSAGVIHRDLKPDNLFLVKRDDGRDDMRVVDFGLARLTAVDANSSQLTRSGEMLGTPSYMSPEQSFGETDLDERTDVWAMGVIVYECLAGKRPFDGGNFGQVLKRITTGQRTPLAVEVPGLPLEVLALVERMLTVTRAERPKDLENAIEVLRGLAEGPLDARVIRSWRRPLTAVAVVATLALAGGLGVAALSQARAPRAAGAVTSAGPSPSPQPAAAPPRAGLGKAPPSASAVVPTVPVVAAGLRAPAAPPPPPASAAVAALPARTATQDATGRSAVGKRVRPTRTVSPGSGGPAAPPGEAAPAPGKVVDKAPF